jgi:hypothetical protein
MDIKELCGVKRSWPILGILSLFARTDCGSHRFKSVGVVGFKGVVYRMCKKFAAV